MFKDEKYYNFYAEQLLEEHYRRFKPTLDQIAKKKFKPKMEKVKKLRNFLREDQSSLFSKPFNQEDREQFYKVVNNNYPNIPKFASYKKALSHFKHPTNLEETSEYYRNNPETIDRIFNSNRSISIQDHPDTETATSLFYEHLSNLPDSSVEVISYYSFSYEPFTLVTIEPHMIFILGHVLFFNLFIPLHRDGGTSYFIKKAVDKYWNSRTNVFSRLWYNSLRNSSVFLPVSQNYAILGCGTVLISWLGATFYFPKTPVSVSQQPESRIARDSAAGLFSSTPGFKNFLLTKVCMGTYNIGIGLGKAFIGGFAIKHEAVIKEIAAAVDKEITKQQRK